MFNFYKDRTFESLLSDTFGFIRQEFKPFFTTLLKLTGPWLLLFTIGLIGYFNAAVDIFSLSFISYNGDSPFTLQFFFSFIVLLFGGLGAYVLAQAGTLYYIQSYQDHQGKVDTEEVFRKAYKNFFSFMGLGVLSMFTIIAGIAACILPVFYLMVPMSLAFPLMVFQNKSVPEAYGDSFSFIKDNWWYAFSFLFVLGIIIGIAGYAFGIPTMIYMLIKGFTSLSTQDALGFADIMKDPIYITLNILNYVFQFLLNFITVVGGAILYFSIYEKRTQKGTLEEIENLGH